MTKSNLAKFFGWLGSALIALGTSGSFGKYGAIASTVGALLVGGGVHQASNTEGVK